MSLETYKLMTLLREGAEHELTENILPFWIAHTPDEKWGGFIGGVSHDAWRMHDEPKGAVLNARILWTFSAAWRAFGKPEYRKMAERAYSFLLSHFWDPKAEGVFWMLNADGKPLETKKQIYAQAFALYGLAEYHRISGDRESLDRAIRLYQLIEQHSYDPIKGGYFEAYSRHWTLLRDLRLSDKDANEKKTMNTHLHVLEAYTLLYQCWPDTGLRQKLIDLTRVFLDTIIDEETHHFRLFFDENWQAKSWHWSFGHDIEGSWLLCEAAEATGDLELIHEVRAAALELACTAMKQGIDPRDGGMFNEGDATGITDSNKHWWPQAEACVGFLNAYQLSGEDYFLRAAARSWQYIQAHIIDRRWGEWFFSVSAEGEPDPLFVLAGPWKCPYHNGRACLELMRRVYP